RAQAVPLLFVAREPEPRLAAPGIERRCEQAIRGARRIGDRLTIIEMRIGVRPGAALVISGLRQPPRVLREPCCGIADLRHRRPGHITRRAMRLFGIVSAEADEAGIDRLALE